MSVSPEEAKVTVDAHGEERDIDKEIQKNKEEQYERETSAIIAWVNTFLRHRDLSASSVEEDFHDGVLLINLLEEAFQARLGAYKIAPKLPFHKLDNISLAVDFMRSKDVLLLSVDNHDILSKKGKPTSNVLWNVMRQVTITGLAGLGGEGSKDSIRDTLLSWANSTFGETVPKISDFWESFRNGIALCAIVENLAPGNIEVASLSADDGQHNLGLAFQVAEEQLGIPSLLKPEDFLPGKAAKEKSVENYVCMLVSAAQGKQRKDAEVAALQQKMDEEKSKKQAEVSALKSAIEEEKKEFETLQTDMDRLKQLHDQSQNQLEEVEEEKQQIGRLVEVLSQELNKTHDSLMEARETQKEMHQREEDLMTKLNDRDAEVKSQSSEIQRLNAEIYRLHREHENVVLNFRSDMKKKAVHERGSSIGAGAQLSDLFLQSIRETKSFNDFLNSMPVKAGPLMKRSKKKLLQKGEGEMKERYVELRGSTLVILREKGGVVKTTMNLRDFQKIEMVLPTSSSTSSIVAEDKQLRRRRSLILSDENDSFVLHLIPRENAHSSAKPLEFSTIESGEKVADMKSIFDWVEEINNRISLIDYLDEMEKKGSNARPCREVIDFISHRQRTELKIENKVVDLHGALEHFKESLVMRKGLSLVLKNVALSDASMGIIGDILARNSEFVSLELPRNLISSRGAEVLAEGLTSNRSLRTLRLDDNKIRDDGCAHISKALAGHMHLSHVNLNGTAITDDGVTSFIDGLKARQKAFPETTFPQLNLSRNIIADEGCKAISSLFAEFPKLVAVASLDHNCITDSGAELFVDAIRAGVLINLDLSYNQLSSKGLVSLSAALKSLESDFELDLSDNKLIAAKGVHAVLAAEVPLKFQKFKIVYSREAIDQ